MSVKDTGWLNRFTVDHLELKVEAFGDFEFLAKQPKAAPSGAAIELSKGPCSVL